MIGYLIVVAIMFGRALIPPEGQMIFGDDIHRQYYFYRQFFNGWIGQGIFPWWNPYLFGGEPFIANPVVNIWYPVNWLFILFPLNIAYSWHVAFHVLWAMLGMHKLTKSRIAGLVFGLSGFFMARTFAGHVDMIAAASWMPWVVYAMRNKNIAIAAITFALQLLSGYQTMAFMSVIVVGIMTLVERRSIVRAILAGMGGVGLAAFHLLPVAEFFRQSIRTYSLPYSWHSYGAIEWRSLLQLLNPFLFGNQFTYHGPSPNFIEHSMFVGLGGLVLAALGIARGVRRVGIAFLLIALFGLWVSLGPNAPVDLQYVLWKIVPMYHYLRIPSRHLILVVFGLAGLAGLGMDRLPRLLKAVITGVIVVEMALFARSFIELKPVPEARHDGELITLLKQDTEPYRVLQDFGVWLPQRDALDFDSVMSYGIFSATGYDPSILRSYFEFASGGNGKTAVLSHDVQIPYITDPAILDRLNVKYLMVPKNYDPFINNPRYKLLKERTYRLYENTTVFPRFYLDGDVRIVRFTPNEIVLEVLSEKDQNLSSSEVWYPGWEAFIDGKKTDITKSEGTFRTLFVPIGKHTVIYRYQPRMFFFGAGVSVLTATILLRMVFRKRKPRRS